jgi:hypothetical protein
MMSRREINQQIYDYVEAAATELVEAHLSSDGLYQADVLDQKIIHYLQEDVNRYDVVRLAKHYRTTWEKRRINPTTVLKPSGQFELGFVYNPKSIVIYSRQDRGFMKYQTFTGTLVRIRLLNKSLKHTVDGIGVQLQYLTEKIEVWDQAKYKFLDDLEKQVFGWQEPMEDPPSDDSDDEDKESYDE